MGRRTCGGMQSEKKKRMAPLHRERTITNRLRKRLKHLKKHPNDLQTAKLVKKVK